MGANPAWKVLTVSCGTGFVPRISKNRAKGMDERREADGSDCLFVNALELEVWMHIA